MKYACEDVAQRLNILQGQVYAACRMGAWCFDENRTLFKSTAPHAEEYRLFLQTGGCLDRMIARKEEPGFPFILGGGFGLAWIGEWVQLEPGGRLLVFLGPVYLKNRSVEESLQRLDRMGISQHLRREYLNVLSDVPVISQNALLQYAAMLHFICYEEVLARNSMEVDSSIREQPSPQRPAQEPEAVLPDNDFQRMAAHENLLLDCLGNGLEPELQESAYQGELQDFRLKDTLRQIKDNLIIFTALCARRSILSGVPLQTAKTMESEWIHRIEQMRSFGHASQILQSMYGGFMHEVQQHKEAGTESRAVRECKDYVRMNYTRPLSLEEIARQVGYTEYYLTKKFSKETGMKLTDYIRSVRVDAAKVLLLTSNKDIHQISEELQFGSRAYFDRVFRQETGLSPARFRDSMGQAQGDREK